MSVQSQTSAVGARAHRLSNVCDRLQIGRTKLYGLISSGQLRAVKIGASTRVLDSDLAAFEASLASVVPDRHDDSDTAA